MSNFQYKARGEGTWDKRAKGTFYDGYALDDFQVFSVRNKENAIRILPPTWDNPSHYGLDLWVHFGVGPSKATVICPMRMKTQKCPICEALMKAEAQGRADLVSKLKPIRRVLVWLLDMKEEENKQNPVLWAMPWTVDRDIAKVCRDRRTGELYMIDHPVSGRDVYFDKETKGGESTNVEYVGFQISTRPSEVSEKHLEYVAQHALPSVLFWRTYEQIGALFEGMVAASEEEPENSIEEILAPTTVVHEAAYATTPPTTSAVRTSPVHTSPPPPPKTFTASWTDTNCSLCGKPQYTTPTGVTCEQGHEKDIKEEGNGKTPVTATPVPTSTPSPSRGAVLKQRFQTGPK